MAALLPVIRSGRGQKRPRGASKRWPITHLWGTEPAGAAGAIDLAGSAHGAKFNIVSGQGYAWKLDGSDMALEFDTSVGGTHSQVMAVGDTAGSGGPSRLDAFTLVMEFSLPSIGQAVFYSSAGGGLQFSVESGGYINLVKSNVVVIGIGSVVVSTTGVRHTVAASYDGSTYRFAVDGLDAGSGTNAQTLSRVQQYFGGLVSGVSFGCPPNGSRLYTMAVIDKVALMPELIELTRRPSDLFDVVQVPRLISLPIGPFVYARPAADVALGDWVGV